MSIFIHWCMRDEAGFKALINDPIALVRLGFGVFRTFPEHDETADGGRRHIAWNEADAVSLFSDGGWDGIGVATAGASGYTATHIINPSIDLSETARRLDDVSADGYSLRRKKGSRAPKSYSS